MRSSRPENPFSSPSQVDETTAPMTRKIVAEGTLTPQDLKNVHRAMNPYFWGFYAAFLLVLTIVYIGLASDATLQVKWLKVTIFLGSPILLLLLLSKTSYYWASSWRMRRAELRNKTAPQRIQLDERGIHLEADQSDLFLPWDRGHRFHAGRDLLVVFLKPHGWIALPAHFFDSRDEFLAAKNFIQELFRRTGPPASVKPPLNQESRHSATPGAVVASGVLTEKEYFQTHWVAFRNRLLKTVAPIGVIAVPIVIVCSAFADESSKTILPLFAIFVLAGCVALIGLMNYIELQQRYRDSLLQPSTVWNINLTGISISPSFNPDRLLWNELDRITIHDHRLTFHYKQHLLLLPRRFFASDEDWRQVIEWARAKH